MAGGRSRDGTLCARARPLRTPPRVLRSGDLPERSGRADADPAAAVAGASDDRGAESEGARRGAVEPLLAGRAWRGPDESGLRAAVRNHGTRVQRRARSLQLFGSRHRQHGGAGALRHAGTAGAVARAAPRRTHPVVLRHDRARRGVVGCHEHPFDDRARGRRLRAQRPQVVDLRRGRSALPGRHLHGPEQPRCAVTQAPVDDPRPDGREGRHGHTDADGLWLR